MNEGFENREPHEGLVGNKFERIPINQLNIEAR